MTDKLDNVKKFMISVVLDGFGSRRFVGHNNLDGARNYLHTHIVPKLVLAIKKDDPGYDYVNDPGGDISDAISTDAVKTFITDLEIEKTYLFKYDPHGELYHIMFKPGINAGSCFLDELKLAMQRDDPDYDPDWKPGLIESGRAFDGQSFEIPFPPPKHSHTHTH